MTTLAALLLLPLVAPTTAPLREPAPVQVELGLAELLPLEQWATGSALDGLWYEHGEFMAGSPVLPVGGRTGDAGFVEPLFEALLPVASAAEAMDGDDVARRPGAALRVGASLQLQEDLRAMLDLRCLPDQAGEQMHEGVVGLQWATGPRSRLGLSFASGAEGSTIGLSFGMSW